MSQRTQVASADATPHKWIFDLLFGATPAVTWAAVGELPDGYRAVDRFAVLPAGADRAFAVSLASRQGASSAVTSYNALRPFRRRLARNAMGLGLRTGIIQMMRPQVEVGVAVAASPRERTDVLISEYLSGLFGEPVVVSFGCGGGPYRKPVLQVFSTKGAALGYVKIGWNDWTRDAVRSEAAALTICTSRAGPIGVPDLLHHTSWRGLDLLITAPLPWGIVRYGMNSPVPSTEVLREIGGLSQICQSELAGSEWWLDLRKRIKEHVADSAAAGRLVRLTDAVERLHGRTTLEFGSWHGDLVPWNLARLGGRLYAWDWESSAPAAPMGFDALHFYFQVAFVARGRPVDEAASFAIRHGGPALDGLGLAAGVHDLLSTLHLLELTVRHEEARSSSGDCDAHFFPAALDAIEHMLERPPGISSLHPLASSA